jgi:hypothetical protein
MQQVPYSEPANIWPHRIKFIRSGDLAHGICAPQPLRWPKRLLQALSWQAAETASYTGLCFRKAKTTAGRNSNTRLQRLRHRGHQYRHRKPVCTLTLFLSLLGFLDLHDTVLKKKYESETVILETWKFCGYDHTERFELRFEYYCHTNRGHFFFLCGLTVMCHTAAISRWDRILIRWMAICGCE